MTITLQADRLRSFAEANRLRLVVLFGSQATGRTHRGSDTDLAILAAQPLPAVTRWRIEGELGSHLGRSDLDIVWLEDASWLLTWEASQGQVLYEDPVGHFADWRTEAWLRYADSEIWRQRDRAWFQRFAQGEWTLNTALVQRKLNAMGQYLRDLETALSEGETDFINSDRHYVAERLTQLLVDGAAAINTEVAQVVANIPPSDYYSSFYSMARTGWIDMALANELAPLARLRNRLVHAYEEVALHDMYDALKEALPHWRTYLLAVSRRLAPPTASA